jgi:amino acid transporter
VVNIAEEIRDPRRTLPKALFITLAFTALLYACVVTIAVSAIPPPELAVAHAPLARVYERLTGHPLGLMSAIAVIATLNGIIVHMIMISRVLYGMARTGVLVGGRGFELGLGHVHPRTQTPLRATGLAIVVILALALAFPLEKLAHITAQGTLVIFFLVNAALARIRHQEQMPPPHIFQAPRWAPYAGMAATFILLVASMWQPNGP